MRPDDHGSSNRAGRQLFQRRKEGFKGWACLGRKAFQKFQQRHRDSRTEQPNAIGTLDGNADRLFRVGFLNGDDDLRFTTFLAPIVLVPLFRNPQSGVRVKEAKVHG